MKKLGIVVLCSLLFFLNSCSLESGQNEAVTQKLFGMDTVVDITVYGENAQQAVTKANEELVRLENLLSVTKDESDITKINQNAGIKTAVSAEVMEILSKAQTVSKQTGGIFDVTVYPVVKAWGFTTDERHVPDERTLQALLPHVDYNKLLLDFDENTVSMEQNMAVDLGGIAKGYASQKIADTLKQNGVQSAVLNLGGNVQTIGRKPDGKNWGVAVEYPGTQEHFARVDVGETSLITSGAYQRYFEENGKKYHHIIDPRTGMPADSGLKSATVVCGDPVVGDALSTALFIMGTRGAQEYYNQYGGFDYILLTEDDEVYITKGIEKRFSLSSGYQNLKLHVVSKAAS